MMNNRFSLVLLTVLLVFGGLALALRLPAFGEPAHSRDIARASSQPTVISSTVFLPAVKGAFPINLTLIGKVENTLSDIVHTPMGVWGIETPGRVVNVSTGEVVLDLSDRGVGGLSLTYRSGYLYTMVVYFLEDGSYDWVVSRFPVAEGVADPAGEEPLLTLPFIQEAEHLGGDLSFGPDGYFYVSIGDGDEQEDPRNHAQDTTLLYGAILRLDVEGGGNPPECDPDGGYTIPADNPFVSAADATCDEIWVYGLRQPWRFSFDRETGDAWIGELGYFTREEIDFIPAAGDSGLNFGWSCYEGSVLTGYNNDCGGDYTFPVFEYATHEQSRCGVIGGYVYRSTWLYALAGQYLFADLCSGEIMAYDPIEDRMVTLLQKPATSWVAFAENPAGDLYIADYATGEVYRIDN